MKVIVPIYATTPEEDSLLAKKINGIPLYLHNIRMLASENDVDLHVFISEEDGNDYSSLDLNLYRQRLVESELDGQFSLPAGTRQCVSYLQQRNPGHDEPLLILDYRAINLNGEQVEKARSLFLQAPESPLMSIRKAKDNPGQFYRAYRIIAMDVLSVIEKQVVEAESCPQDEGEQMKAASWYRSQPFTLEWDELGYPGAMRLGEFFLRRATGWGFQFFPVSELEEKSLSPDKRAEIYQKVGAEKACRYFEMVPVLSDGTELCAVSALKQFSANCCLVVRDRKKRFRYELFLHGDCWKASAVEIRLQPFFSNPEQEALCHTVRVKRPETVVGWQNSFYYGPALSFNTQSDPDGFLVSVLSWDIQEGADFSEPVSLPHLISISADSSRIINKITGEEITGRQNCPDFFQFNGALVFAGMNDLLLIKEKFAKGATRGFIFEAVQVRTQLDLHCNEHSAQETCINAA